MISMSEFASIVLPCEDSTNAPSVSPLQIMGQYVEQLFAERDQMLNLDPKDHNQYLKAFQSAWKSLAESPKPMISDPITDDHQASVVRQKSQHSHETLQQKNKDKGIGGTSLVSAVPAPSQDIAADEVTLKSIVSVHSPCVFISKTRDDKLMPG